MRRPTKKKIEQSNEAVEEPPARPPAPEPADPPSPDAKQVKRVRPPQSPGMAAVKAAAYEARKALRVAEKADMSFLNDLVRYKRHKLALIARMSGISRDWIKKGRPGSVTHLERMWKAELEDEKKHVWCLQSQVVAHSLACDAKDAEIAAQEARIKRLTRLLRVRSGKV